MGKKKIVFSDIVDDEELEAIEENDDKKTDKKSLFWKNESDIEEGEDDFDLEENLTDEEESRAQKADREALEAYRKSKARQRRNKNRKLIMKLILILSAATLAVILLLVYTNRSLDKKISESVTTLEGEESKDSIVVGIVGNDFSMLFEGEEISRNVRIPIGTDVITKGGSIKDYTGIKEDDELVVVFKKGTNKVLRVYLK